MDEVLLHATTWMNLENIMLSEISQTQRDKYCLIPLIQNIKNSKFIGTESRPGKLPGTGGREPGLNWDSFPT